MLSIKKLKDKIIAQLQQQCNSIALSKSDLQQRFTQSSRLQNSIAQSSLA
jgi:hypothetical protein